MGSTPADGSRRAPAAGAHGAWGAAGSLSGGRGRAHQPVALLLGGVPSERLRHSGARQVHALLGVLQRAVEPAAEEVPLFFPYGVCLYQVLSFQLLNQVFLFFFLV